MNKLIIIFLSILMTLGFFKQTVGQNLSKNQSEQIKTQVDSVFQVMLKYAEALDFDQLSSGVDDSHATGFIANEKYYPNYSLLINDVKDNAQGIDRQAISLKEKQITVLSEKIVLLTASGVVKAFIFDGRVITANFNWSFIYEMTNGNWKVIYSHQSTNP